jgi:uncharacterized protein (DUF2267 family)
MDYDTFVAVVKQRGGIDREQAESISCFALSLLAQRLPKGAVDELARRLPEPLRPCMRHDGRITTYHAGEFLQRIERQLGPDHAAAEPVARGVLAALRGAVGRQHFASLRAELPGDFAPLLEAAEAEAPPSASIAPRPFPGRFTADEFVRLMAQRAHLVPQKALTPTSAVLETLAMRITRGQVEDLKPFIPPELRHPLDRGMRRGEGRAQPMPVDEFLDEIARLEAADAHEPPDREELGGLGREQAATHARAVLSVLHQAVGEKEFHDTIAQLPRDLRPLPPADLEPPLPQAARPS